MVELKPGVGTDPNLPHSTDAPVEVSTEVHVDGESKLPLSISFPRMSALAFPSGMRHDETHPQFSCLERSEPAPPAEEMETCCPTF